MVITSTSDTEKDKVGSISVYACRDMKPGTLVILPFSVNVIDGSEERPAGAVPMTAVLKPEKEKATEVNFWIKPKSVPNKWL